MYYNLISLFLILLTSSSIKGNEYETNIDLETQKKPTHNIMLIIADDMNTSLSPWISTKHPMYGHTSNLDKLMKTSTTYMNAHAQIAVCGPSRASIFTGKYPETLHNYHFRQEIDHLMTIPKKMKQYGYITASFGKTFHFYNTNNLSNYDSHWDSIDYTTAIKTRGNNECKDLMCSYDDETKLIDYKTITKVIDFLTIQKELKETNQKIKKNKNKMKIKPWFTVVGFRRPHLSNAVPKKLLSQINMNLLTIKKNEKHLVSPRNIHNYICQGNKQILKVKKNFNQRKRLIKHYYAAIKWVDNQIGRLMEHVPENTMIIFLSDHGWYNGEDSLWCKSSNFNQATHVPLIIRYPQHKQNNQMKGKLIYEQVELVSLYKLITSSKKTKKLKTSEFSYSQYPRCKQLGSKQTHPCTENQSKNDKSKIQYMTYAIRNSSMLYMEARLYKQSKPFTYTIGDNTDWSKQIISPLIFNNNNNIQKQKETTKLSNKIYEKFI